jgi:ubiquinone/menaquinone biosynthesis C-methylase UbiE
MATRTAAQEAAFFLPFLRPGMRVLDVGCGPGSITLGLAEVVAPGVVVGIDVDPAQVEQAQALAEARSMKNARFEVADIYRLPFPNGSFDAAFAHTVVMGRCERGRMGAFKESHKNFKCWMHLNASAGIPRLPTGRTPC